MRKEDKKRLTPDRLGKILCKLLKVKAGVLSPAVLFCRLGQEHNMAPDAIYRKLTEIFREVFDDDSIVVRPELTAKDVDEWDSLSHIRLVLSVERAFGLKFSASEIGRLKNVGEFVDLIQAKA